MCVRYTLHKTDAALGAISRALGVAMEAPDWAGPRYNVTLTDTMPVVACEAQRPGVRAMRWGLVPPGERGKSRPRLLANARSETAAALPAFRRSIAERRCLVPANGFYEWMSSAGVKLPHLFTLRDEEPFAFAGIWDPAAEQLPETYCILTTEPNELVARVHNRMPVILTAEAMPRWLGDRPLGAEELKLLVRPIAAERMASRPVSRFVSNSRNEGPRCLAPPDEAPPEPELDFA
ncbi:MAG TPA: SOS response-associated peptidase [Opitutaceae bacterium]|nr:SOS response-associated peptidase [Opitutaceae bacterium]